VPTRIFPLTCSRKSLCRWRQTRCVNIRRLEKREL